MSRSRKPRRQLRVRPGLAVLEDRTVPALDFSWAIGVGSTAGDRGWGITTDGAGDVYVTGQFQGTVDFDPGPGTLDLVSGAGEDAFVAKYSAAGSLVWAVGLGADSSDGVGIAVDGAGNVYATGQGNGGYLTRLDAATGALVWTRQVGNTYGTGVAVDGSGNVYVVGEFSGSSQFGPFTLTAPGNQGFVTKLDAAGNFLWAKAPEGSGWCDAEQVAVDAAGNVHVTGGYFGTVDFDPAAGSYNLTSMGGRDIFAWKLDTGGNFVWARSMGSIHSDTTNGNGAIALDGSGNVYLAGGWGAGPSSKNDFDPGPGTLKLSNKGHTDIYVVKLSSSGNLVWARSMGGSGVDVARSIAIDSVGDAYTTGSFDPSVDFDPGKGTFTLTSAGSQDIFVSKLTSAGNFAAAVRMGGAAFDLGWGIAVDGSNNVYTTGQFRTTADFDPGPGTFNLTTPPGSDAGAADIFVSKLTQPSSLLAAGSRESAGSSTRTLTLPRVRPLLNEALARWQAAGVDTSGLGRIDVRIADLGGATLGLASGNTIWLDDNAAGWGWFVDRTPRADTEFTRPGNQGERNRVDLLTVLMHEVGHLLGQDHHEDGVMGESLGIGVRRTPTGGW